MSDLQDFWLRSQTAFPTRESVAVILRIFSLAASQSGEDWHRSASDWLSLVESPEAELEWLAPKSSAATIETTIKHLCSIIAAAAESWEKMSITAPTPETVVVDVLNQLSVDGIVKLYYG